MLKSTADAQTRAAATAMTAMTAMTAFLNSLIADQRKKVQFPFTPPKTAMIAKFSRSGVGRPPGAGDESSTRAESFGHE